MLELLGPEVFQAIVDRLDIGVYAVDREQRIFYWNHGAGKITGFLSQNVLGRSGTETFVVRQDEHNPLVCAHQCPLEGTRGGVQNEVLTYVRHHAGHVVPVHLWTMALRDGAGNIAGAVKVFAEKAVVAEAGREEAHNGPAGDLDVESGIPSRASIESFLLEKMKLCEKQGRPCGIICIQVENLDGFRHAHGMEAGAALMREMGRSLTGLVRRSDAVGRWSGDRFLGVLPGCGIEPLQRVAERMGTVASNVAIPWWGDRVSLRATTRTLLAEKGDTPASIEERLNASSAEGAVANSAGA